MFRVQTSRRQIGLFTSASTLCIYGLAAMAVGEAAAQPASFLLEEILVTAQKREENLRDVPVSVSALSGDAMTRLGFTRPHDIFQQIPNTSFNENGGLPQLNIRGVQLYDFGGGNEPPVGYYVDEVYMGTLGGHIGDIYDVERVEVLRGPQGTLFGRNTTGGLAHWVTRKPTEEFEAYASFQYGSFDQFIIEGAVSGPLADNVRARAAVKINKDDGWQKNDFNSARFSAADNVSGRLHVEVDFSENITGLFNMHASRIRGQANHVAMMGLIDPATNTPCSVDQARSGGCVSAVGSPSTFKNPRRVSTDRDSFAQDVDAIGGFARFNVAIGDNMELVSITAYEYVDRFYEQDADGSTAPVTTNLDIVTGGAVPLALPAFYNSQSVTANQFSQELRVSGTSERINWLVGAFYYDDDKDDITFDNPQIREALGSGLGFDNQANLDTKSWAVFGQADVYLTDSLSVTGGIRYTHEKKDLLLSNDFENPLFLDEEQLKGDAITFKGSINYRPLDDTLIYVSAAKGFKSGAFKTTFAFPGQGIGADKEVLYSYELGVKSEVIPGRLQINASTFYNDYKDLQILSVVTVNGVPGSFLINVGDAEIYGLELDATYALGSGFAGTFGVGLMDSKIKSDDPAFDGNEQALSPTFSLNGVMRYTPGARVFGGETTFQISGSYLDDHFLTPENHPTLEQDGYFLLGANLSWTEAQERFSVDVFVDNILDEVYGVGAYQVADFALNGLFMGRPRSAGIRLRFNW